MQKKVLLLLTVCAVATVIGAVLVTTPTWGATAAPGATSTPSILASVGPSRTIGTVVSSPIPNTAATSLGPVPQRAPAVAPAKSGNPLGAVAIRPSVVGASAGTELITVQDATAYAMTYPVEEALGRAFTVGKVLFLTSAATKQQLGLDTGLEDNRQLCVVQLNGSFTMPTLARTQPRTSSTFYLIFDARTGNLLIEAEGR